MICLNGAKYRNIISPLNYNISAEMHSTDFFRVLSPSPKNTQVFSIEIYLGSRDPREIYKKEKFKMSFYLLKRVKKHNSLILKTHEKNRN